MAKSKAEPWVTGDGLLRVQGWAGDGFTDKEIWTKIGISGATFYNWCNKYQEFLDAIKKGRAPVEVAIEDAFYSRCDWVCKPETTTEKIIKDGVVVEERGKTVMRWYPPDTGCLIFALKNLKRGKYQQNPVNDAANDAQISKARELLEGIPSAIDK